MSEFTPKLLGAQYCEDANQLFFYECPTGKRAYIHNIVVGLNSSMDAGDKNLAVGLSSWVSTTLANEYEFLHTKNSTNKTYVGEGIILNGYDESHKDSLFAKLDTASENGTYYNVLVFGVEETLATPLVLPAGGGGPT